MSQIQLSGLAKSTASDVIAGLVGALLITLLQSCFRWVRSRRLEAEYPIAGSYISEFMDDGMLYKTPASLKQNGTQIKGTTTLGTRKWLLEGNINKNGYLIGTYRSGSLHDRGLGSFFLKIDPNRDMRGIWSGLDANKNEIQQGSYVFRRQLNDLSIRPIGMQQIPEILCIAEAQLGDAYIRTPELLTEGAFYAHTGGRVAGFATSRVGSAGELLEHLQSFFPIGDRIMNPVERRLRGQISVGFIATVAVDPRFEGRGVGTMLVDRCIAELNRKGVILLVATAWQVQQVVRTGSILVKRGFQAVLTVPEY